MIEKFKKILKIIKVILFAILCIILGISLKKIFEVKDKGADDETIINDYNIMLDRIKQVNKRGIADY